MKKDILWGIVFSIIVSFFASGIITNIAVYVSLLLPNKGINLFLLIALSALVYVGYMAFGVRLAFRKNIFVKKNLLRYGILPIILWIILAIYNIGVLGTLTRKNIEHVKMNLGINYKMFLKVSTEDNGFGVLDKLNSLSRVKLLEINKIAGKIHDNFIENQVDIDQNFGEIFNVYEIILDSLYFYKYFQPVWLGDIEKEDMYLINSPYRKTCLVFNNITMLYFYYYYKNGKYDKVIEGLDKYTHVLDLFNMFPDYKLRMDILNRSKWILELFDSLLDKRNDESLYSCIDTFTKFLTQNSFIILSKPIEENGYIKSATEMNIALYDYLNLEKNFIFTVSVATPLKNSIDYLMSLLFLGGGTNAGLYPMSKIMLE
ncbi:hypothetical protein J7K43_07020, partial [Candidatus Calescamantes bacterium]|nr:hypothetical protein [Candidatus Calescamantes bacterium]